jgi:hypothetical protein
MTTPGAAAPAIAAAVVPATATPAATAPPSEPEYMLPPLSNLNTREKSRYFVVIQSNVQLRARTGGLHRPLANTQNREAMRASSLRAFSL